MKTCLLCDQVFPTPSSLGQHVRMKHKLLMKDYLPPRFCERCGGKIETKGTKFCSRTCWLRTGSARRAKDPAEQRLKRKMRSMCYSLLHMVLHSKKVEKTCRTSEMLGYDPSTLRKHLEGLFSSGMSWSNHGVGPGKWNVDHIKPINTFPAGTHPSVVNSLKNLRPLWFEENVRRPYDGSDVLVNG